MKIISKKEWDNTPEEWKRIYDGTPYMLYKENETSCFGPVKIIEGDKIIGSKKLGALKFRENEHQGGEIV